MFSPSGRFGASGPKVAILWFALVALAALSLLVPASLAAGPTGAPGNNGTVKVHDGGAEPSPEVRNQPHVCTFHLHFFFADAAQSGSWQIRSWSPTGDGSVVLAGTYTTDANGEYRTPPAPDAYTLPNGHYKVFWEGRNSQNIKHKVFWVDCPAGAAQGSGSQETAANTPVTDMVANSLITSPADGARIAVGLRASISGIAWDGGYGISVVEIVTSRTIESCIASAALSTRFAIARLIASGSAITLGKSAESSVLTRMPSSRPLNIVRALSTRLFRLANLLRVR